MEARRILVLKLGALGNIILSLGAFAAIRRHHPRRADHAADHRSPMPPGWPTRPGSTRCWSMRGPPGGTCRACWRCAGMLRGGQFDRVYDLQTSSRSLALFPSVPARRAARVVRHRARLFASRPRPGAQPYARHRPPARPVAPGRHRRHPAGRPVLVPRRHRPLRPAAPVRPAGAGQCAASSGEALAGCSTTAPWPTGWPARASRRSWSAPRRTRPGRCDLRRRATPRAT